MSGQVFERIYEVVRRIPYGKVATYGQVAAMAGNPRWARVVGYALHVNPDPEPIWRSFQSLRLRWRKYADRTFASRRR